MIRYKVGIWGQFGDGGKIADGQAVRTTIITRELQRKYGNDEVGIVNTNNWKKRKLSFLLESIKLVRDSQIVIIAPADNGYKVFVPILVLLNLLYRRRLFHVVIGGFLPSLLKSKPLYLKFENRFSTLFVQTENLKRDLYEIGITSDIQILSNLKRLDTRKSQDLRLVKDKYIKVCVFSRIYKDKGVEDAIEAVRMLNTRLGERCVSLDLYGLLPDSYQDRLHELLTKNSDIVEYKGIIDYDRTVEVLKDYFVMLFPTYYHGEGFPGNVIDAYNSGLPMIATDWLYNSEVVLDGRTGLLVPVKDPVSLCDALSRLYADRELHYKLSQNALKESSKYSPDKVLANLYNEIEK
jgi:glycosyltransferase involved in cell wall biosynthesis